MERDDAPFPYATFLDVKFPPLTAFDIRTLVEENEHPWYNQTLCRVNDSVLRLGVFHGEYHWHKHDRDDELFFVLEGVLLVDLEDRTVELKPWQGFVVPRGIVHRTRAPEHAVVLMMETAEIVPTGDE
ncbi:MAG: cupin domain-containing protein [Armatimonadetes bacterium]|nr:MAG: cupin domain-containing protein [Armatimonadota bacterium]